MPTRSPPPLTPPRLLFVDDEPGLRRVLGALVARARPRWEATFVASGAHALEALASRPFDVLVTDLEAPWSDRVTLLERVAAREHRVVRVVHSSAPWWVERGGLADATLAKPADARELLAVLDLACACAGAAPR